MMMSVGMISFHRPTVRIREPDANEYYSGWERWSAGAEARSIPHAFAALKGRSSTCRWCLLVMIALLFVLAFLLFVAGGCGYVEIRLPIFLDGGREFVEVGEQHGDLPHVGFAESLVPCGHAG